MGIISRRVYLPGNGPGSLLHIPHKCSLVQLKGLFERKDWLQIRLGAEQGQRNTLKKDVKVESKLFRVESRISTALDEKAKFGDEIVLGGKAQQNRSRIRGLDLVWFSQKNEYRVPQSQHLERGANV